MKHIRYALICSLFFGIPTFGMETDNNSDDNASLLTNVMHEAPAVVARAAALSMLTTALYAPIDAHASAFVDEATGTSNDIVRSFAKLALTTTISKTIARPLTAAHVIPADPPSTSWPLYLAQFGISSAASYVAGGFTNNIIKNYRKKGNLIKTIEGECALTPGENSLLQQRLRAHNYNVDLSSLNIWKPQHIHVKRRCSVKPAVVANYSCRMFQEGSTIIVSELAPLVPEESSPLTLVYRHVTEYETDATYWNYRMPFGIHRFRPAIERLHTEARKHHVSIVGTNLTALLARAITEAE